MNKKNISRPHLDSTLAYFDVLNTSEASYQGDDIRECRSRLKENQISNDWMARYFGHSESHSLSTPFQGIYALPANSSLRLDSKDSALIDLTPRYRVLEGCQHWDISQWVSKWRFAVHTAVKHSIENTSSVAIMLSSGIDSAGLVAHLKAFPDIKVKGFSWRFPNHPEADESLQIQKIVDYLDLDHEFIDIHDAECFDDLYGWPMSLDAPYFNAMRRIKEKLYERVSEQGFTVLLNGHVGDELAFVDNDYFVELLKDRPFEGVVAVTKCLFKKGVAAKNDPALRMAFKKILHKLKLKCESRPLIYSHLTPSCAKHLFNLGDDITEYIRGSEPNNLRKNQFSMLLANSELNALATEFFYTQQYGIERRHPYLHEELISLALACPAYLLSTPSQTKWLARKALTGMLPEDIIWADRVGQLDSLFEQGLEKNSEHIKEFLFQENRLWPNFVDERQLSQVLNDRAWNKAATILVPCIGLERWLAAWREEELPLQFEPMAS